MCASLPARSHHLRYAARIIAICLVDLSLRFPPMSAENWHDLTQPRFRLSGCWNSLATCSLAQISHDTVKIGVLADIVCRQSISDSLLGNLRECLAHLV